MVDFAIEGDGKGLVQNLMRRSRVRGAFFAVTRTHLRPTGGESF